MKDDSKQLVPLKIESDDLDVEFEILPVECSNEQLTRVQQGLVSIDDQLAEVEEELLRLNNDIDKLTNHADGIDYSISVICGIVTGIIDIVFVGEWNFEAAKADSYEKINNKVIEFAKKQPDYNSYCILALEGKKNPRRIPKDPSRLETAISFLEWKFHLPGDGAYSKKGLKIEISANTHRLDDLCHHPNILGLLCSIIVQFSPNPKTKYINKLGEPINLPIVINEYGNFVGNNFVTKLFSGVINWFITCAKTASNWKGHMYSDVSIATEGIFTVGNGNGLCPFFIFSADSGIPVLFIACICKDHFYSVFTENSCDFIVNRFAVKLSLFFINC